jgi:30S ribosomal protein S31
MGRGDKKSKKGKITKGSYGKSRNRKAIKAKLKRTASKKGTAAAESTTAAAKPKRTNTKKKAEA